MWAVVPIAVEAQAIPTENPGIIRWAEGSYQYRALSDDRATGRETFRLTVAPDGTRTMRVYTDIFSRGVQANVVVRVASTFRPLTAYVDISTKGVLKGSAFYIAGDRGIDATVVDAVGQQVRTHSDMPEQFSFGTHPLALDGWSTWYAPVVPGQIAKGAIYLVNGDATNARPMVGDVTPVDLEYVGEEQVTVPAGTFPTQHYRIAGQSDVWVTGEDRLLVKYVWSKIDRQYLLSELIQGRSQRPAEADKREKTR